MNQKPTEPFVLHRSLIVRLLVCLLALSVSTQFVGCASTPKKDDKADLTEKRRGPPEFFENIPAETPYVMAGVEPMPMGAFSTYMSGYADFFRQFEETMKSMQHVEPKPGEKFFLQVSKRLFEGYESEEGMTSLGFKENAYTAVYGIGLFPVFRIEMSNPEKLEQVIASAEADTGFGGDMRKLGEQVYRFYDLEGEVYVAVAFTDSELIMGGAPPDAFDAYLPYMLGQKKPETSLADTKKIQDLIAKYGFDAYSAGYVDTKMLTSVMTGESAPTGVMKEMLDAVGYQPPGMEPGCRSDAIGLATRHPRLVFGYTGFTPSRMSFRMGVESTTDLPERLAKTKTEIPNYNERDSEVMASMGAGIDVSALLDVIADEAKDIGQNPYECSELSDLNQSAKQAGMYLGQVPPFVRDITGVSFELRGVGYDAKSMKLDRIEAIAMVETRNPSTLLAQLQMFVPQFSGVGVKPDGVPVAIKPFETEPYLKVPHVAMTDDTLAMSIGVGMQDELAVMLEDKQAGSEPVETPMFTFGYDYGRVFSEYDNFLSKARGAPGPMGFNHIAKMFGFANMSFDVTANSYFVDMDIEMKPDGGEDSSAEK